MVVIVSNTLNTGKGHLNILRHNPDVLKFYFINAPGIKLVNENIPLLFSKVHKIELSNPDTCNIKVSNIKYIVQPFYPENLFKLALVRGWSLARLHAENAKSK